MSHATTDSPTRPHRPRPRPLYLLVNGIEDGGDESGGFDEQRGVGADLQDPVDEFHDFGVGRHDGAGLLLTGHVAEDADGDLRVARLHAHRLIDGADQQIDGVEFHQQLDHFRLRRHIPQLKNKFRRLSENVVRHE